MDLALQALRVVAQHLRLSPEELALWRTCRSWYSNEIQKFLKSFTSEWQWIEDQRPGFVVLQGRRKSKGLREFQISLPCSTWPAWPITDGWRLLCAALVASNEYDDFLQLQAAVSLRLETDFVFVSVGSLEVKFSKTLDYMISDERYTRITRRCVGFGNAGRQFTSVSGMSADLDLEVGAGGFGHVKLTVWENHTTTQKSVCWLPNSSLSKFQNQLVTFWPDD